MQFSDEQWQKMETVYEASWKQTFSPIHVIKELRAKFDFGLAEAKYVFDKLHYRENYQRRQEEIEKLVEIATQVFAEETTSNTHNNS